MSGTSIQIRRDKALQILVQKENGELVRCKFLFKSEKHSVEELLEHVNIPVKPNQELKCTLTPGEEFKLFISVVTKENDPSVEDLKVNPLVSDLDELNGNGSYEASGYLLLPANKLILISVRGEFFWATVEDITKCGDGIVSQMFEQNMSTPKFPDSKTCFINRDPDCFQYILDYLKTGVLVLPEGFEGFSSLLEEAQFYNIKPLVADVQRRLANESINSLHANII